METWPLWARVIIALVLLAHGVAHLVGVFGMWGVELPDAQPMPAPALSALATGVGGKAMGAVWLVIALGFAACGIALVFGVAVWGPLVGVTIASLAVCLLAWPMAPVGIGFNAVLLVLLGVVGWWGARS